MARLTGIALLLVLALCSTASARELLFNVGKAVACQPASLRCSPLNPACGASHWGLSLRVTGEDLPMGELSPSQAITVVCAVRRSVPERRRSHEGHQPGSGQCSDRCLKRWHGLQRHTAGHCAAHPGPDPRLFRRPAAPARRHQCALFPWQCLQGIVQLFKHIVHHASSAPQPAALPLLPMTMTLSCSICMHALNAYRVFLHYH